MPNYYAHLTFGQSVLGRLSPPVSRTIERQREGFDCGLYGPDPLFFYHNGLPGPVVREGHTLHAGPPGVGLERLRGPVEAHQPYALGYALGYLCHYLLDRACHPYVYANASADGISHMAMEGEFDRLLMQMNGIDPHSVTPMKRPAHKAVFAAAANAYTTVDAAGFRTAMAGFYRVSHCLTLFQGTALCSVVNLPARRSSSAAGLLLSKEPSPEAARTNTALLALWEAAADSAVPFVEQACHAYLAGEPLDFLPSENFKGEIPQ